MSATALFTRVRLVITALYNLGSVRYVLPETSAFCFIVSHSTPKKSFRVNEQYTMKISWLSFSVLSGFECCCCCCRRCCCR